MTLYRLLLCLHNRQRISLHWLYCGNFLAHTNKSIMYSSLCSTLYINASSWTEMMKAQQYFMLEFCNLIAWTRSTKSGSVSSFCCCSLSTRQCFRLVSPVCSQSDFSIILNSLIMASLWLALH